MSGCCDTDQQNQTAPRRHKCPMDGRPYTQVPYKTVLHHLKHPWSDTPVEQAYYFCDNPNCDVIYFGLDNAIIKQARLRTAVGLKEASDAALICYCFGVSKRAAREDKRAKPFVIQQTRNGLCACTTLNPSGKCCLKDFSV